MLYNGTLSVTKPRCHKTGIIALGLLTFRWPDKRAPLNERLTKERHGKGLKWVLNKKTSYKSAIKKENFKWALKYCRNQAYKIEVNCKIFTKNKISRLMGNKPFNLVPNLYRIYEKKNFHLYVFMF